MSALVAVALGSVIIPLGIALWMRNTMGVLGFAGMLFYAVVYWFRVGACA